MNNYNISLSKQGVWLTTIKLQKREAYRENRSDTGTSSNDLASTTLIVKSVGPTNAIRRPSSLTVSVLGLRTSPRATVLVSSRISWYLSSLVSCSAREPTEPQLYSSAETGLKTIPVTLPRCCLSAHKQTTDHWYCHRSEDTSRRNCQSGAHNHTHSDIWPSYLHLNLLTLWLQKFILVPEYINAKTVLKMAPVLKISC